VTIEHREEGTLCIVACLMCWVGQCRGHNDLPLHVLPSERCNCKIPLV